MHLTLSVERSQVSQRQERGKTHLSHLNHMQQIAVYRREPFSEETSLQRALMPQYLTWGGLPGWQQDGSKGAAAPGGDGPGSRLMLKSHPCSPRASPCSAAQSHTFIQPWINLRSRCTDSTETLPKPASAIPSKVKRLVGQRACL